jgi:hypothetical protein
MSGFTSWEAKYGTYYDYKMVEVDIPTWATYFDFVFNDGSSWDNNGGNDFHRNLAPFVKVSVGHPYEGKRAVTVRYRNGSIAEPIVHAGEDGWRRVQDVTTRQDGSYRLAELDVSYSTWILNLCFHDGNGTWENNYGMDWNIPLR